jgi:hypothetical protein
MLLSASCQMALYHDAIWQQIPARVFGCGLRAEQNHTKVDSPDEAHRRMDAYRGS